MEFLQIRDSYLLLTSRRQDPRKLWLGGSRPMKIMHGRVIIAIYGERSEPKKFLNFIIYYRLEINIIRPQWLHEMGQLKGRGSRSKGGGGMAQLAHRFVKGGGGMAQYNY